MQALRLLFILACWMGWMAWLVAHVHAQQTLVLDVPGPKVTLQLPQGLSPVVPAPAANMSVDKAPSANGSNVRSQLRSLPPLPGSLVSAPSSAATPGRDSNPSVAELALPSGMLLLSDDSKPVPSQESAEVEQIPTPAPLPAEVGQSPASSSANDQAGTSPESPVETAEKYYRGPGFYLPQGAKPPVCIDGLAYQVPYQPHSFAPPPISAVPSNADWESLPYRGKQAVPTQRPWLELWRPLYTGGTYPPAKEWFGPYNLVMPHFMVYGDWRTGAGFSRNDQGDATNLATRLNLDMDLEITATERIHAFMGPLDRAGDFTRFDFTDSAEFVNRADLRLDTLFFEGDAGAIWGGLTDQNAPFDLPFSFGFLPLFYQNGIWANDNVLGAAMAIPSRNSPQLNWANYDATFFWASDQITSDAFPGDNNAAEFFGTAWFIDAYDGYIEADYAFVRDDVGQQRSYHNLSFAFTRRYFYRLSNSVRFIANFGQDLPEDQRTADGHLILIENSLISAAPNTFVPYMNFFYGQGRTQSLARAGIAGGILTNTGINFEIDGLNGFSTLDATAFNTAGAAAGLNILGADFSHQLVLELAALAANGSPQFRNAPGDQYAAGVRYQKPLNNAWIFRTDHMFGWRRNADDLRGSRIELRWKF